MVAACPFPSLRGSQALIRELSEALAENGHEIHVVTYPSAQHIAPVERISIHRVPRLPLVAAIPAPISWQKFLLDVLLVFSLWRVVRQHDIEVLHAHNIEAPYAAFLVRLVTGVPVVYHAHNAMMDELPYYFRSRRVKALARTVGRWLDSTVARRADHVIALTSRLGAYLAVRGAAGRVSKIPPGVYLTRKTISTGGDRTGGARIVYAGNLDHYQNIECLVDAFERICAAEPRSRLVFLLHQAPHLRGAQRVDGLSSRPGISVRSLGTLGAVSKELRNADVLVCPRTSWSGFPIKILNYMAAGRPIVQARSTAHVLEDGKQALFFEDGDPGSLAKAVLKVTRDQALAEALGIQGRDLLEREYGWPAILPKIEEVYRIVLRDEDLVQGRKNETLESGGGRMTAMPRNVTRQLAAPTALRARKYRPILASMACALVLFGCAGQNERAVAPLPAIAAPAVPGALSNSANYLIESGDQVRVKFLYHPELDVKVPVGPDGTVHVPGVGVVRAAGKTADEVAGEVEAMSSVQLRDPEVTVIVAELGDRFVYVGGEVRLPGTVRFREGMTPLQAILDRGGFTEVARVDSVLHLRPNSQTAAYDTRRLDYTTNINEMDQELATLQVYDAIIVPRSFIGDANSFVRLYIRGLLPTMPRVGVGFQQ